MLNITSYLPAPLIYAAIGCAATAVVMKYGAGKVAESIRAVMSHPVVAGTTGLIMGGIAGFYFGVYAMVLIYNESPAQFSRVINPGL